MRLDTRLSFALWEAFARTARTVGALASIGLAAATCQALGACALAHDRSPSEGHALDGSVDARVSDSDASRPCQPETCNLLDDDCDGAADEGTGVGAACSIGEGMCRRFGTIVCNLESERSECHAGLRPPAGAEECNGADDDCDGAVDEGEICPNAVVANAMPYLGSVGYVAQMRESCGRDGVFAFWPTYRGDAVMFGGCGCEVDYRVINDDVDAALWVTMIAGGIHRCDSGSSVPVEVEACAPRGRIGLSRATGLHYVCGDVLYRGDGSVVATGVNEFLAVLDDGRAVVLRENRIEVVNSSGRVLCCPRPYYALRGLTDDDPVGRLRRRRQRIHARPTHYA